MNSGGTRQIPRGGDSSADSAAPAAAQGMTWRRLLPTCLAMLAAAFALSNCSRPADRYYPLTEGSTWEYQVVTVSKWGISGARLTMTNLASRAVAGKPVTPQKAEFGGVTNLYFVGADASGVYEVARQTQGATEPEIHQASRYYVKSPVRIGTSWDEPYRTSLLVPNVIVPLKSTIQSTTEVVTVGSQTFPKCLKVSSVGSAQTNSETFGPVTIKVTYENWYALEVGNIKSVVTEESDHLKVGRAELTVELETFKKSN